MRTTDCRPARFELETFPDPREVHLHRVWRRQYADEAPRQVSGRCLRIVIGRVDTDGTGFWNLLNGI